MINRAITYVSVALLLVGSLFSSVLPYIACGIVTQAGQQMHAGVTPAAAEILSNGMRADHSCCQHVPDSLQQSTINSADEPVTSIALADIDIHCQCDTGTDTPLPQQQQPRLYDNTYAVSDIIIAAIDTLHPAYEQDHRVLARPPPAWTLFVAADPVRQRFHSYLI